MSRVSAWDTRGNDESRVSTLIWADVLARGLLEATRMTNRGERPSGTETLMGYVPVSFANLPKRVVSGELTAAPAPEAPPMAPTDSLVSAQELAWFVANTDRTETQDTSTESPRAKTAAIAKKRWPFAVAVVAVVTLVGCAAVYLLLGDSTEKTYVPADKLVAAAPKPKSAPAAKPAP